MDPSAPAIEHDISSVYEAHFEYVWNNLRRLGVEPSDLEDAVHDVFVVAHRRRDEFRGTSSMRTWLFGITRRVARDHRRFHFRHRRRLDAVRQASPRRGPPEPPQERAASSVLLQRFLDSLDEGKRSVFVLAELEQMTGREVAEALHINPNTAASRLRAARQAFDAYARRVRHADRILVERPPPIPDASRRRAWALVAAELARPTATGVAPIASAGVVLGKAKAVGITLALAVGGLAAIRLVGVSSSGPGAASPEESAVVRATEARPSPPPVSSTPRARPETRPSLGLDASSAAPGSIASSDPRAPPTMHRPRRAIEASREPRAPPPAEPSPDALAEHNRRLADARAALARSEAGRARQLAEDYLHRFADGIYADEMQLVQIQALGEQGECDRARSAAGSLARRRPGTTLAELAAAVCRSAELGAP